MNIKYGYIHHDNNKTRIKKEVKLEKNNNNNIMSKKTNSNKKNNIIYNDKAISKLINIQKKRMITTKKISFIVIFKILLIKDQKNIIFLLIMIKTIVQKISSN